MSKKPGLFSRLKSSISGTLSDAVDSVRDPGQEIALMLDDLAASIVDSEKDLKQGLVDQKVMERKLAEMETKEAEWASRAEQAINLGNEELARAALTQKNEVKLQREDTQRALEDQRALVTGMQVQIKEAKARLKTLNLRRGSLMAQARAAKKGPSGSPLAAADGAVGRLAEIEGRINEMEAMNEAAAELNEAEVEAARIDAELAKLDPQTDAVDDELEALKAKMKARGALTAGDDADKDA